MSRIRWRWASGMLMNDGLQNSRTALSFKEWRTVCVIMGGGGISIENKTFFPRVQIYLLMPLSEV